MRTESFPVAHRTANIGGLDIFYREAGPPDAPAILLLHGFPSSSRMFAGLLPLLAARHRVVAPDYPGFGHSASPPPEEFAYTFDHLAARVGDLCVALGLARYALYLQDYGGPVGFRLALAHPERVAALVLQNAVIHEEGLSPAWEIRKAYWRDRAAHEGEIRRALLSPEVARQRHLAGARRPERIDPDTWTDELAFLTRPGMDRIQLDLTLDYASNVALYPRWQAYLRDRRPPTLVVWGKNDPVFTVEGALAYGREVPDAEIHLFDAGHFVLDEEADAIAFLTLRFLSRRSAFTNAACASISSPSRERDPRT